jgi:hypothetical protein
MLRFFPVNFFPGAGGGLELLRLPLFAMMQSPLRRRNQLNFTALDLINSPNSELFGVRRSYADDCVAYNKR